MTFDEWRLLLYNGPSSDTPKLIRLSVYQSQCAVVLILLTTALSCSIANREKLEKVLPQRTHYADYYTSKLINKQF